MKASVFEMWFEDELLNCLPKGHVIIMDNAAFHKKEVLQNLAKKYSQELIFLPPYSPEYTILVCTDCKSRAGRKNNTFSSRNAPIYLLQFFCKKGFTRKSGDFFVRAFNADVTASPIFIPGAHLLDNAFAVNLFSGNG